MALQTKDFSVTGKSSGGGITYTYILRVTENSVNAAANTSNVTVQAILKQSYSGTAFTTWYTGVSCTLCGSQIFSDYKQRSLSGTAETVYYTWTGDIAHDDDGSKSLTVGGKLWQSSYASYSPPAMTIGETASDVMALTSIPRASAIGATAANIGETAMIAVSRKSAAYTHSIAYGFGALSGYIRADGSVSSNEVKFSDTSVAFVLPESFYAQIPNDPYGICTLTCRTYSGSTQIGDAQTCTFRATAARAVCAPEVSGAVEDGKETTIALTGDKSVLVRYMSNALCTITAQAKNSASLTGKAVGGVAVSGTSRTMEGIESSSVVFTATDSRGYSTSTAVPVSLVPYIRLTCNPTVRRTDPTGGNAQLTIRGNYYNGSFGAADNYLEVSYTVDGEEFTVEVTPEGNSYQATVLLEGLDYQSSHTITVRVEDALDSVEKNLTLGKGVPVFDWGEHDFSFHVPVTFDSSVSGAHIRMVYVGGSKTITLQTDFSQFYSTQTSRQSIYLFGSANGVPIHGLLIVHGDGGSIWSGTGDVSTATGEAGKVTITLPITAWDPFILMSAKNFSIL